MPRRDVACIQSSPFESVQQDRKTIRGLIVAGYGYNGISDSGRTSENFLANIGDLFPNQSHVHSSHTAALSPDHNWIDFEVGKMIPMRGEDIGQPDHRAH